MPTVFLVSCCRIRELRLAFTEYSLIFEFAIHYFHALFTNRPYKASFYPLDFSPAFITNFDCACIDGTK